MTFPARLGLAIVHPRWALAHAGDRRNAGRSGSDLLALVGLMLLATQLRGLFGAAWVAERIDVQLGVRAAGGVLTDALTVTFALLIVVAAIIWAGAGRRRELGRAFDLACVALVPVVIVELVATTIARCLEVADVPDAVSWLLAGASYAWSGGVVALAVVELRDTRRASAARAVATPAPAGELVGPAGPARTGRTGRPRSQAARRGGRRARRRAADRVHRQASPRRDLRPMTTGDAAPTLALPRIAPGGKLADRVDLGQLRGKLVVVDFWATWCRPCCASMPALDALTRHHPDVAVLSINMDDARAARAIFDDHHYAMTLLADDGETSERYGVSTIPHLVLIDADGRVRQVIRGGGADLEAAVAKFFVR